MCAAVPECVERCGCSSARGLRKISPPWLGVGQPPEASTLATAVKRPARGHHKPSQCCPPSGNQGGLMENITTAQKPRCQAGAHGRQAAQRVCIAIPSQGLVEGMALFFKAGKGHRLGHDRLPKGWGGSLPAWLALRPAQGFVQRKPGFPGGMSRAFMASSQPVCDPRQADRQGADQAMRSWNHR